MQMQGKLVERSSAKALKGEEVEAIKESDDSCCDGMRRSKILAHQRKTTQVRKDKKVRKD